MIQDRYDGPKNDPKNLATQSDITELRELIAAGGTPDNFGCYPIDGSGVAIGNGTDTSITLTHPEMSCVDVCIFDTASNRWTSADIQLTSSTSVTIAFRSAPANNQFRVYIRGKLAS